MGVTAATLLFLALVLALAALPLVPAWREWRRPTDARPLRVVRTSDTDVRWFARGFRRWLETKLGEEMASCRAGGAPAKGRLPDGTAYEVVPAGGWPKLAWSAGGPAECDHLVAGCGALKLPPGSFHRREVYAAGAVEGGEWNIYRALLADGDVRLGSESRTLRWLHAGGSLLARPGCRLYGRASADRTLRLEVACRFERLHAPTVAFSAPALLEPNGHPTPPLYPSEVRGLVQEAAGRWLVRGDLRVPPHRHVPCDLVVTGKLVLGRGAHVAGAVKSRRDLVLEDHAVVEKAVVSGRDLTVGRGCVLHGPVVAERDARVGAGTRIGTLAVPTTLAARRLAVEGGAVVHGTVWAREGGEVLPRPVNGYYVYGPGHGPAASGTDDEAPAPRRALAAEAEA